jgi:hypothetical protein
MRKADGSHGVEEVGPLDFAWRGVDVWREEDCFEKFERPGINCECRFVFDGVVLRSSFNTDPRFLWDCDAAGFGLALLLRREMILQGYLLCEVAAVKLSSANSL